MFYTLKTSLLVVFVGVKQPVPPPTVGGET
jgi:hypothetical protein